MGGQLSAPTREVTGLLVRLLDVNAAYRGELVAVLRKYLSDADIGEAQALQWTGEKLLKDLFDPQQLPTLSAAFQAAVTASPLLSSLEPSRLRGCVCRGCVLVLEELKLDLVVHGRLFACAAAGRVEGVRKLSGFVDFDYTDEAGATVLMVAAHHGHALLVDFLLHLQPRPVVDAQDAYGWTALMHSARHGHLQVVRQLTAASASVHLLNHSACDALMCAADQGHFAIVQLLLARDASPLLTSRSGESALLLAAKGGHLSVVKALAQAGADVNQRSARQQHTPLSLAAQQARWDLVEYLVSQGAAVDGVDAEGRSVCHFELPPSLHAGGALAAAIQRGIVSRFNALIRRPVADAQHSRRITAAMQSTQRRTQRKHRKGGQPVRRAGEEVVGWGVAEDAADASSSFDGDSDERPQRAASSSSSSSTSSSQASSSSDDGAAHRAVRLSGRPSTPSEQRRQGEEKAEAAEAAVERLEDEDALFLATERMAQRLHQRQGSAARSGREQVEEGEEEVGDEDEEVSEGEEASSVDAGEGVVEGRTAAAGMRAGRLQPAMGRVVEGEDDEEGVEQAQPTTPPPTRRSLPVSGLPTSQSFPLPQPRRPPLPAVSSPLPSSASPSEPARRRRSSSPRFSRPPAAVCVRPAPSSASDAGLDSSDIDDDATLLIPPQLHHSSGFSITHSTREHGHGGQPHHQRGEEADGREGIEAMVGNEFDAVFSQQRNHHSSEGHAPTTAAAATAFLPPHSSAVSPSAAAARAVSLSSSSSPSSSVLPVSVPGSAAFLTAAAAHLRPPRPRRSAAGDGGDGGGEGGEGGARAVSRGRQSEPQRSSAASSPSSPSSSPSPALPSSPGRVLVVHRRVLPPSPPPPLASSASSASSASPSLVLSKAAAPLALDVRQPKRRAEQGGGRGGGAGGGGRGAAAATASTPPRPSRSSQSRLVHSDAGDAAASVSSPAHPPSASSSPRVLRRTSPTSLDAARRAQSSGDGGAGEQPALLFPAVSSSSSASRRSPPHAQRPTVRARLAALRQAAFLPSSAAALALREATQERGEEGEEAEAEQRPAAAAEADDSADSLTLPLAALNERGSQASSASPSAERLSSHRGRPPPSRPSPRSSRARQERLVGEEAEEGEEDEEEREEDGGRASEGSASESSAGSPTLSGACSRAMADIGGASSALQPLPPARQRPHSSQASLGSVAASTSASGIVSATVTPSIPSPSSFASSLLLPAHRAVSERRSASPPAFRSSSSELSVGLGAAVAVSDNIHQSPSPQPSPRSPSSSSAQRRKEGAADGGEEAATAAHRRSNSHPLPASALPLTCPSSQPPLSTASSPVPSSSSTFTAIHPRARAASPLALAPWMEQQLTVSETTATAARRQNNRVTEDEQTESAAEPSASPAPTLRSAASSTTSLASLTPHVLDLALPAAASLAADALAVVHVRTPPPVVLSHADWRSHLDSTPVPAWLHHYAFEGAAFHSLASLSFRQLYQLTADDARQRLGKKKAQLLLACTRSYAKAVQQAYVQRQQQQPEQSQRDASLPHSSSSGRPSPLSRGGAVHDVAGLRSSTRGRQRRSSPREVVLVPAKAGVEEEPLVFVTPPPPAPPPQPPQRLPSPAPAALSGLQHSSAATAAGQNGSRTLEQLHHAEPHAELLGDGDQAPIAELLTTTAFPVEAGDGLQLLVQPPSSPHWGQGQSEEQLGAPSSPLPAAASASLRTGGGSAAVESAFLSSFLPFSRPSPHLHTALPSGSARRSASSSSSSLASPAGSGGTPSPASLVRSVDSLLDRSNLWLKTSSNALLSIFHDSTASARLQPAIAAQRQPPHAQLDGSAAGGAALPASPPPSSSAHTRLVASLGKQLTQPGMDLTLEPQPF